MHGSNIKKILKLTFLLSSSLDLNM